MLFIIFIVIFFKIKNLLFIGAGLLEIFFKNTNMAL